MQKWSSPIRSKHLLAEGVVKWFDAERGYGFIRRPGERDLFVHFSEIQMEGYKTLDAGQRVSFEVGAGPNGQEQAHGVGTV